jgi:peptide/nickel transport system substrate-binding protein
MRATGYWPRAAAHRLTRRRGIVLGGGVALGAAFLAACGGSDNESAGEKSKTSSLIAKVEDTTKEAKRGGVLKLSASGEPQNWDPHGLTSNTAALTEMMYSRLVQIKPGYLKPADGSVEPDAAESWELSPEKTQITFKLRPNVAFQNIAPVNGRFMDAEDVAFSFVRMSERGIIRTAVSNRVNPNAPVISVTATDPRTVAVKLKEPLVFAIDLFTRRQALGLVPKEAASAYNPQRTPIGSGAYQLDQFEPSVRMTFKRHDKHWDQPRPYVDSIEYPFVPQYATGLSQFRAGNIHWYANLRAEDVLDTKRSVPQFAMYQTDVVANTIRTLFGLQPSADGKKSPFLDARVRQAYSMAMDRDLWIEVVYNTDNFKKEGLAVDTRWNTALVADVFEGWWLDPKAKDFGPNAQYYQHNVAEAKKLLSAAGYATVELQSHIVSSGFGPDFLKLIEILEGFAAAAGFKLTPHLTDYNTDYIPNYRDASGRFSGVAYKSGPAAAAADAVARLEFDYHSKASDHWYGYDVNGRGDFSGDPFVDQTISKAKLEFDDKKRLELVHELQRYLAKTEYAIRHPGGASSYDLASPAIRNYGVFNSDQLTRMHSTTWWLDSTKN